MARRGSGGGGGQGQSSNLVTGESKTVQLRDFSLGLTRAGSRPGIPDTGLWNALNAQIIGPGQIQTLTNPGTALVTLPVAVVSLWGVILNLAGTETTLLVTIHADGSARSTTLAGATTVIATAGQLSTKTRLTTWQDTHILFADPTTGFSSWDGTTFVTYPATFAATEIIGNAVITWTAGPIPNAAIVPGMSLKGTGIPAGTFVLSVVGAAITMSANAVAPGGAQTITVGTGAPTSARDIAVFEGRVWLVTGNRGITFSGPGSFTAFETVYAAGSTVLIDPSFPGAITRILSALELLWIFGPAAIDTLSNVQVSLGQTTFQIENLVSGIGTPWPSSVQPLFRTLVFDTPQGIYAVLGSTPQKLSDALDGLFPFVGVLGSDAFSAVFTLNGLIVYAVLVTLNGAHRLLLYSRPSWAVCEQGATLVTIATVIDAATGVSQAWGSDGTHLFRLFTGPIGTYGVSTKLFDFGAFTTRKTIKRVGIEAELTTSTGFGPDIHLQLDNEVDGGSVAVPLVGQFGLVTWINAVGDPVTWVNALSNPVTWSTVGRVLLKAEAQFSGNEVGVTLSGTSPSLILGAIALEVGSAGEWTFGDRG